MPTEPAAREPSLENPPLPAQRIRLLPWGALAVSLTLVFLVQSELRRHTRRSANRYFENLVEQQIRHVEDQLLGYELLFRSVAGISRSSGQSRRDVWNNLEKELALQDEFRGIDAFGGAKFDSRDGEPTRLQVIFATPDTEAKAALDGFDLFSVPKLRKEALRSCERGSVRVSDWVPDETDSSGVGFWLLHPIPPPDDSPESGARGVFFMRFGLDRFLKHADILPPNLVGIQIMDRPRNAPVYDAVGAGATAAFSSDSSINIYGDNAYVRLYSLPGFEELVRSDSPAVVAFGGTIFSLLLFGVLLRLASAQKRAEDLAAERQQTINLQTAELQNAVSRLRTIIDSEPECIKTVARDGTLLEMDPAGLALIEADRGADAIGRNVFDLVHEEDRERFIELHNRVMNGGEGELSFKIVGLKGNVRNMETRSVPLRNEAGKVLSVLSITREVSERLEAERKLKLAQFSLDHAVEAIFFIREDGSLTYANEAAADLLGWSIDELLQLTAKDVFPHCAGVSWKESWEDLKDAGSLGRETACPTRSDGEIPVEMTANLLEYSNEEICCVFVRDLRERLAAVAKREELERQLRQSGKMEAIGTLAGGIAHDFNNILAAIVGYTGLAKDESSDDTLKEYLGEIETASRRARNLVSQILTFSRDQEVEMQPVHFSSVVTEAVKLLRAALPATVEIRTHISGEDGSLVLGNATQIHQIVMNLGANAQQAMADHGLIEIEITPTELTDPDRLRILQLQPGLHLRLTFRDEGPGIPEDIASRIFDPFFTTKPSGKGTGLGLSVIHGIVKQHHAAIEALPGPKGGSEFRIYFPTLASHEYAPPIAPAELPRGSGQRILHIDDEAPLLKATSRTLERLGYRVESFVDPEAALERLTASPRDLDLILTDLSMPKLDGLQLAKKAAELAPDLPVVLASGYGDAFNIDARAPATVRAYLDKPVEKERLAQAIHDALAAAASNQRNKRNEPGNRPTSNPPDRGL